MKKQQVVVLLASLLILSACAIVYELLISTVSTYLLGSSVLHFSITIGLFLSFLGVGAYLSRYLTGSLLPKFILIEFVLALAGGYSAAVLYIANAWFPNYYLLLFGVIAVIGALAGMEIPLVTRLLEKEGSLRDVISRVLAFDYLGALAASLAFPLLMLPLLGSMRAAFFTGLINWSVAAMNLWVFRDQLPRPRILIGSAAVGLFALAGGFIYSFQLVSFADALHYQDQVVLRKQTPYQKLVVTRWNDDLRLYINGNLQFSSVDEYRYHEALVHIPMLAVQRRSDVLVLGGGDGLALREILKYPDVRQVDVVDLDAGMVELARINPLFTQLNQGALDDPRVRLIYEDAFNYVKNCSKRYNVILIDLPDPSEPALGKLYSTAFYRMVRQICAADGVAVTQSTAPFLARAAFWCIHQTMSEAFEQVLPYQAYVPSFGLWGFQLAVPNKTPPAELQARIQSNLLAFVPDLRFLTVQNIPSCFVFDKDTAPLEVPANTLETMQLVRLYEASYIQFH
jgi:spermidine synthase